jgi:large subunit ribosomal protein L29
MPDSAKNTRDFLEQIREASELEVADRKSHIIESLFNLRFRLASGQIEDPKRVRKYRKAIARINTILRERELGINQK